MKRKRRTPLRPEPALARRARSEGIERAEHNADEEWKQDAYDAVVWCASHYDLFTADEVWERLEHVSTAQTHQPSAMGPVFLRAARDGVIENTKTLRPTWNARRHRDLIVWRSL